jgi:hypothetical protein
MLLLPDSTVVGELQMSAILLVVTSPAALVSGRAEPQQCVASAQVPSALHAISVKLVLSATQAAVISAFHFFFSRS